MFLTLALWTLVVIGATGTSVDRVGLGVLFGIEAVEPSNTDSKKD